MLDAGGYPVTFTRFAFGEEPEAVQSMAQMDPDYEVDSRVAMLLNFSNGRFATLQTGFDAFGGPGALLFGEKGMIEVPQPYHPPAQSQFIVRTRNGEETYEFDTGLRSFTPAVEQFQSCILDGEKLLVTSDNAIGTLQVTEAVRQSAQSGICVSLM